MLWGSPLRSEGCFKGVGAALCFLTALDTVPLVLRLRKDASLHSP